MTLNYLSHTLPLQERERDQREIRERSERDQREIREREREREGENKKEREKDYYCWRRMTAYLINEGIEMNALQYNAIGVHISTSSVHDFLQYSTRDPHRSVQLHKCPRKHRS